MGQILKDVRPLDYALAAVMVAAAAFIGYENTTVGPGTDLAHAADSTSALMVPVFALAAAPILWRRRAILSVIGVSLVVLAASLPAFGWATRCGFALPLSFAMAYAVARYAGRTSNQVVGLAGILALQVVTLVQDASTGGLGALALGIPVAAVFYGAGLFVQNRSERQSSAPLAAPVERAHV